MEQIAFDVPGLCTPKCERTISALINIPGVQWATAASRAGGVGVHFDPHRTDLTELREVFEAAGFRAAQ